MGARHGQRGKGEGSVFPYRNGFAAYVWVTRPNGTRARKYVYGKTREAVHAKWVSLHQQARRGPVATSSPTVGQYLDYWLTEVVRPNLKPRTAERYAMHVRLHIAPYLGPRRLDRLSVRDARLWLNELVTRCQCCAQGKDARRRPEERRCCAAGHCCRQVLSRQTVASARGALASALTTAMTEEVIGRNVAALVKLPPARRRRVVPWSVDEARTFLDSARSDDDPFLAAYVLILVLGLRRGEVLGLTWDRVDLEHQALEIGYGLQRVDGELCLAEVKTDASEATLPLPAMCLAALAERRGRQDLHKAELGGIWPDPHGLVFTSRYATPIDPRNFVRSFKARARLAGVREIRVHDTRHTCGSLLAALDVHPRVAMQILRHSKIAITMEIYTHVPSEMTRDALRRLGDRLDGTDVA